MNNFLKQSLIIIVFVILNIFTAQAQIFNIMSLDSIFLNKILNDVDQNTLVLIDIDNTVVVPRAEIFSSNRSPYINLIGNLISSRKKTTKYNAALKSWYTNRKLKLLDDRWPILIDDIKSKGATVIGLPIMDKSWYDLVEQPAVIRYKELKELGINFTKLIMNKELLLLDPKNDNQIIFYYGIIFNGFATKLEALIKFMKFSNLMPSKVVIIDSSKNFLNNACKELISLNIQCHPFLFQGTKMLNVSPNINVINLQKKLLLDNAVWIEEEQAQKMLSDAAQPVRQDEQEVNK